jgi:hypothetical protein
MKSPSSLLAHVYLTHFSLFQYLTDLCEIYYGFYGFVRRRWEDNIEMDLQQKRWMGMGWADMAQNKNRWQAFANVVMNFPVP